MYACQQLGVRALSGCIYDSAEPVHAELSLMIVVIYNGFLCSFYTYDSGERCLVMTTVAEGSATFNYTEGGDLKELAYINGNRRTFQYDEYSRLCGYGSLSFAGEVVSQVSMVPDWNGKVTMSVLPRNKTFEVVYNTDGEVVFLREEGSLPLILTQLPGRSTLMFGDKVCICKVV